MTTHDVALVVPFLAIALVGASTPAEQTTAPQPPVATKRPHTTEIHGYTLKDDYFWLREKSNPEVIKYLESENAYTEEVMQPTKALQETLYNEMLGRIKQTDLSVPSRIGEYFYYSRTEEGKQYPYMCRRKGSMEGAEEILLDLNTLAQGHKYLGLGAYAVSDDGNWLAYSTDTTGYRQYSLHVKDLRKGQILAENIERVGSVVWTTDNKTLFYTTEDAVSKRSDKFWRHTVGATGSDLVYEEKDELFDVGAGRSLDKKVIFLTSYAKTSTEVRYLPADAPAATAQSDPAARGQPRVQRRPLQRSLLHHHQQGCEEFQGGDCADERSFGEELDGLHRPQSSRQDQRPDVFCQPHCRLGTRRWPDPAARDRSEDQAVAPHCDRRAGLRPVARRQSRVRRDHGALQLSVDGHAIVGLRLRPEHAAAKAPEAAGSARRLRSLALRGQARVGRGARRDESADLGRAPQGRGARRQGAVAACTATARTVRPEPRRSPRIA